MQAAKVRQVGFQRLLILIVAISILAGAIVFAAISSDVFRSTDQEPQVIERSVPVARPTDRQLIGGPNKQQATPRPAINRPTDRP
jgi:hypothetical protein